MSVAILWTIIYQAERQKNNFKHLLKKNFEQYYLTFAKNSSQGYTWSGQKEAGWLTKVLCQRDQFISNYDGSSNGNCGHKLKNNIYSSSEW